MDFKHNIYSQIKLDQSIIPSIPFLWYREEQLICPIEYIFVKKFEDLKLLILEPNFKNDDEIFIIIQRNVLDNCNIYICLHSFMFYLLNKNGIDKLLVIPSNYNKNMQFSIKTFKIFDDSFIELINGLKINEICFGPVFIHDSSFSPLGYFHFKLLNSQSNTIFLCDINCVELNINVKCLFILINDINNNFIDNLKKINLLDINSLIVNL